VSATLGTYQVAGGDHVGELLEGVGGDGGVERLPHVSAIRQVSGVWSHAHVDLHRLLEFAQQVLAPLFERHGHQVAGQHEVVMHQ
jgi:hypothetical protein